MDIKFKYVQVLTSFLNRAERRERRERLALSQVLRLNEKLNLCLLKFSPGLEKSKHACEVEREAEVGVGVTRVKPGNEASYEIKTN